VPRMQNQRRRDSVIPIRPAAMPADGAPATGVTP